MITLTRRDFVILRRVIRQSLMLSRSDRPTLHVTAGPEGMKIEWLQPPCAIPHLARLRHCDGRVLLFINRTDKKWTPR